MLSNGSRMNTARILSRISTWAGRCATSAANASIATLDTPAILGVTLFIALVYVATNLVVDLVQAALDPRIRLR